MTELEALTVFTVVVVGLVALDVGVFHRRAHRQGMREAALWSMFWILLSLAFCGGVYFWQGRQQALEFLTAYVLEKSLSLDNLFVFAVIFESYRIAAEQQQHVLGWGIYGALVTRAAFIAAGVFLIERFGWVLYVFGVFLVLTGIHLILRAGKRGPRKQSAAARLAQSFLPFTTDAPEGKFFLRRQGRLHATPMLLALVTIEAADVLFAADSIPAVFGVTRDPFLAYTSNILAVVGMRSLYFVLAAAAQSYRYLNRAIPIILIFIGAEMLAAHWYKLPVVVSLLVISAVISVAIAASRIARRGSPAARPAHEQDRDSIRHT